MSRVILFGFNPDTNEPLDGRIVVETIAERDALNPQIKYSGLVTYVTDVDNYYSYDGSNWNLLRTLTPEEVLELATVNSKSSVEPIIDSGFITALTIDGTTTTLVSGSQGPQGERGAQGVQGERGIQGLIGEQGVQGPQGNTGDTGAQGTPGATGSQGDKGDKGDTGAQGPSGSATEFVVDSTGTFAVNYISNGMGNFDTYQLNNGGTTVDPQGGMFKYYTSTVIVDAAFASAGANDFALGTAGTFFFRRKDTNNVDIGDYLDNLTANGGTFTFVDSANRTAVWDIDLAGTAITYDPVAPATLYTAFRVNQVSLDMNFNASTAAGVPLTLTGITTSGIPFKTYSTGDFSFLDNTPRTLWWRSGDAYTTSGLFTDVPGQGAGWTEI